MRILNYIIGLWFFSVLPLAAQQISVDEFVRVKKKFLRPKSFQTDKRQAILDLYTEEKGFSFSADGRTDVMAEEGDRMLTLSLPHRTHFLVIKHPDYGQLTWKVPDKGLKKKKHYRACLRTYSQEKEYRIKKQWVVFYIQPKDAIIQVDSVLKPVREGKAQFYLPIGEHACQVEAPFHETWRDTLCLTDTLRTEKKIELQPFYSFLTVKTLIPDCKIYIDKQLTGSVQATSTRLLSGMYRLTVLKDSLCFYDTWVELGKAEKKTIDLTKEVLVPQRWIQFFPPLPVIRPNCMIATTEEKIVAPVCIKAIDKETEIIVNRELMGHGKWEGRLATGFYAITAQKAGLESNTLFLWIDDDRPQSISIDSPQAAYGMLNIHSNVIDAEIYVNDIFVGYTPSILRNVSANHNYVIRLCKSGYKEASRTVRPYGNELSEIEINLRKK